MIIFGPLEIEDIHKIIDIELKYVFQRVLDLGYSVQLTDKAKNYVVEKGWDAQFGARPLKRAIQKYIEDPLAEEILRGSFKEGTKIVTKHVEGADDLVF